MFFWLKICPGVKYKNTGRDTLGIELEKKKALKILPINIKHYQYQWTNKAILSILHHKTNSCDILTSPTSYSQLLNYMHYIFNLDLFFFFFLIVEKWLCFKVIWCHDQNTTKILHINSGNIALKRVGVGKRGCRMAHNTRCKTLNEEPYRITM